MCTSCGVGSKVTSMATEFFTGVNEIKVTVPYLAIELILLHHVNCNRY